MTRIQFYDMVIQNYLVTNIFILNF
jgi:hypothetical protein